MVDELKILVEAVNAVSGDAKDVLICWIVVKAIDSIIVAIATLSGIWIVERFFRYLVKTVCGNTRLMRAFGKNTECWDESDLQKACDILKTSSEKNSSASYVRSWSK